MSVRLPRIIDEVVSRPTWPGTLPRPLEPRNIGVYYDTSWTRAPWARAVRRILVDNVTRPFVAVVTAPRVLGREHLDPLDGPVIFAANHSSHLDTSIVVACLPQRFRHRTVVAAAADYFFDRPWKAALWSLTLGTIPMERTKVNRRSADLAASLLTDRWNVVIFPEGGRTLDGWGQEFRVARPISPNAATCPSCRCTCGECDRFSRRAGGRCDGARSRSASGTRCGRATRRDLRAARRTRAISRPASRSRLRSWPTRPRRTGGRRASAPRRDRHHPSEGRTRLLGVVPGLCRQVPAAQGAPGRSPPVNPGDASCPTPQPRAGREEGAGGGPAPSFSSHPQGSGGGPSLPWLTPLLPPEGHQSNRWNR